LRVDRCVAASCCSDSAFFEKTGLEKELGELKDAAQYIMDLYVTQEEGAEHKLLIDQLNEAEGRIKGLLLDSANLAAVVALSTVKHHDPSFDL
jgi:hypothetical protein